MPKKKQQNIIRTEYLEKWIGIYRAHGLPGFADTLIKVARDVGAPIDAEEIEEYQRIHEPYREPEKVHKDQIAMFPV